MPAALANNGTSNPSDALTTKKADTAGIGALLKAYRSNSFSEAQSARAQLRSLASAAPSSDEAASRQAGAAATAAAAVSTQAAGDPQPVLERNVVLGTNAQFVDIIRQAMDQRPMVTPQRISIDLQTPPGANVTVYFSQAAGGQIRAQLSANDAGSLQWLQQQVGSLKQGGDGPSVVWLPPQLDAQSQSYGQQPGTDPRQQQNTSNPSSAPTADDLATAESIFGADGVLASR